MSDNNQQSLGLGVSPTGYDKDHPKPTLSTLPEELLEKIMINLHPFHSACLGITGRKFYRIHWELNGIVKIGVHDCYHEGATLSMLLNTWMEERGLVWVVEAQERCQYSVEYSQWRIYVHHFPGVFVTFEWLKSPGQEVRKDPIALDGDEPIYIDQVGMYPKIDGKVERGEGYGGMIDDSYETSRPVSTWILWGRLSWLNQSAPLSFPYFDSLGKWQGTRWWNSK